MNAQPNNPFFPTNVDALSESTKASLQTMAEAYATWLKNANRLQGEAIRFVGDRLGKDMQLLARFSTCQNPNDFLSLQSEAATELVNDYLEEGARWIALLADGAKKPRAAADKAK